MKFVLFTLDNWINKLQEIAEGNEKTGAVLKGVMIITFFFHKTLQEPQRKRKDWKIERLKAWFWENFDFRVIVITLNQEENKNLLDVLKDNKYCSL